MMIVTGMQLAVYPKECNAEAFDCLQSWNECYLSFLPRPRSFGYSGEMVEGR